MHLVKTTVYKEDTDVYQVLNKYWTEDVYIQFREKYGKKAQIIKCPPETELSTPILVRKSSKQKMKHL